MTLAAATISEGVLGLEGLHTFRGFTLNDMGGSFPRCRLTKIVGLHSRPDSEDNREPAQGTIGEVIYPGLNRGKTIVYSGRIEAQTLPSLRTTATNLRSAFFGAGVEDWMSVAPPAARGGLTMIYAARVLSCDIDDEIVGDEQSVVPHAREFVISLRQSNPRYFGDEASSVGHAGGVAASVTNAGNAPVDPLFILDGPLESTVSILRTSGDLRHLTFGPSLAMAAVDGGKQLLVGFGTRPFCSCPQLPGADFMPLLTFGSDWWDDGIPGLVPGAQNVRCDGAPTWAVQWRPAVW